MAAYSQQIYDARESHSPAQSTKTSLSLNEYGDLTYIYFLNTENDITGGFNLVEMGHEGRKDISASINDSVYLAPAALWIYVTIKAYRRQFLLYRLHKPRI